MHTVKMDAERGLVLVDLVPIADARDGGLAGSIARLCSPPVRTSEGRTRYRLIRKATVYGNPADCVIEVLNQRVCSVTFLFDWIEFFEFSVRESKILKACEKSSGITFIADHPASAFSDFGDWAQAHFLYDAKQGSLSLDITFQCHSTEPSLKA